MWVAGASGLTQMLFRVDAETGEVAPIPLPGEVHNGFIGLAVGEGSVWMVTSGGNVFRFDPPTKSVVASLATGGIPGDLIVDESNGSVWVTSVGSGGTVGSLIRIDAATNRVVQTLGVGCCPGQLAIGQGSIWVTDSSSKKVVQVSSSTNDVANTYSFDVPPSAVAVGRGFLWVTLDKLSS